MVFLCDKFQHGPIKKWSMPFCAFFTTFTFVMTLLVLSIDIRGNTRHPYRRFNSSYSKEGWIGSQESKKLIAAIKRNYLRPPPQSVEADTNNITLKPPLQLVKLVHKKKDGVFVEAGAYSRGIESGSEWLERKLGWRGLLTQAHPEDYAGLVSRARPRSYTANVCISPTPYPQHAYFRKSSLDRGKLSGLTRVPCFPLYSLILAYNTTTIDLLFLNLLTAELQVLKTVMGGGGINIRIIGVITGKEDTCCTHEVQTLLKRHNYTRATPCPTPPSDTCYYLRMNN